LVSSTTSGKTLDSLYIASEGNILVCLIAEDYVVKSSYVFKYLSVVASVGAY
jgi:hypothetical protein